MEDLSLHILDIAENATAAGATLVEISIRKSTQRDVLELTIKDNGRGMDRQMLEKVRDPFVTTRTTRRVGLGLPLLAAAAERCDGKLAVEAGTLGGTEVTATFRYSHIDRAPMGDMASTMATLLMGNPQVDFVYTHVIDSQEFILDTRELKKELGDNSLEDPMVIHQLGKSIRTSLNQLISNADKPEAREKNHGKIDD